MALPVKTYPALRSRRRDLRVADFPAVLGPFDYTSDSKNACVSMNRECPMQMAFRGGQVFLRLCRHPGKPGYLIPTPTPTAAFEAAARACECWRRITARYSPWDACKDGARQAEVDLLIAEGEAKQRALETAQAPARTQAALNRQLARWRRYRDQQSPIEGTRNAGEVSGRMGREFNRSTGALQPTEHRLRLPIRRPGQQNEPVDFTKLATAPSRVQACIAAIPWFDALERLDERLDVGSEDTLAGIEMVSLALRNFCHSGVPMMFDLSGLIDSVFWAIAEDEGLGALSARFDLEQWHPDQLVGSLSQSSVELFETVAAALTAAAVGELISAFARGAEDQPMFWETITDRYAVLLNLHRLSVVQAIRHIYGGRDLPATRPISLWTTLRSLTPDEFEDLGWVDPSPPPADMVAVAWTRMLEAWPLEIPYTEEGGANAGEVSGRMGREFDRHTSGSMEYGSVQREIKPQRRVVEPLQLIRQDPPPEWAGSIESNLRELSPSGVVIAAVTALEMVMERVAEVASPRAMDYARAAVDSAWRWIRHRERKALVPLGSFSFHMCDDTLVSVAWEVLRTCDSAVSAEHYPANQLDPILGAKAAVFMAAMAELDCVGPLEVNARIAMRNRFYATWRSRVRARLAFEWAEAAEIH